jgi:hypothetical protein
LRDRRLLELLWKRLRESRRNDPWRLDRSQPGGGPVWRLPRRWRCPKWWRLLLLLLLWLVDLRRRYSAQQHRRLRGECLRLDHR